MGIKLAIVGAGSSYCPELMQGLIRRKDKITLDELRLSDIDESRLSIVGEFCERRGRGRDHCPADPPWCAGGRSPGCRCRARSR